MTHPKPHATALDFESERRRWTTAFQRADGLDVDVVETQGKTDGTFIAQLPDGDPHKCYLVRDGEQYHGFCSCKGYRNHFEDTSEACAHLCALRQRDVLYRVVPQVDDLDVDDEDGDAVDHDQDANADDTRASFLQDHGTEGSA